MRALRSMFVPLVLLTATAASAQVTGVVTESRATLRLQPGTGPNDTEELFGTNIEAVRGSEAFGSGAAFAATSRIARDLIEFRNGSGSAGAFAYLRSQTAVDITFRNDEEQAFAPTLRSTIAPAGLGLYTGPPCLSDLRTCGPGARFPGDVYDFQDFMPDQRPPIGSMIAGASFNFVITGGGSVIYQLSGSVALVRDEQSGMNTLVSDLGAAQAALAGFRVLSDPGSQQQLSFAWDATELLVNFPAGLVLQPGESSTLSYETTVESFSRAPCFAQPAGACMFAYSAFGDPIGRGGGIQPLTFDTLFFQLPTFQGGQLTYQLANRTPVPEPSVWAALIAGFAMVGGAMRARRGLSRPARTYG